MNNTQNSEKLCPYKITRTKEHDPNTGRTVTYERFEVCAGPRCMAYQTAHGKAECQRLRNGT